MINSVNFNPNITQHPVKDTENAPVTQPSFEGNREMSPEVSNAYRAYGQAMVNHTPLSFDDYVAKLISQGKIEGKDFEIEHNIYKSMIHLRNKDNRIGQSLYWINNGNKEDYDGKYEYTYDNKDRKIKEIYTDKNNKKSYKIEHYYDHYLPSRNKLTNDGFNPDLSLKYYMQYLNRTHKKFEINEINTPEGNSIVIDEFDKKNNLIQKTSWLLKETENGTEYLAKSKTLADKNGVLADTIVFDNDETTVVTDFR